MLQALTREDGRTDLSQKPRERWLGGRRITHSSKGGRTGRLRLAIFSNLYSA
jgi:hypothetical protein